MFSFLPTNRLQRHGLFWLGVAVYFLLPQLIYPDYVNTVGHYFFGFAYTQSPYFLLILFGYGLGVGMIYAYAFLRWVIPPMLTGRYGSGLARYVGLTVVICYLFRLLKALHMAMLDPWLRHQPTKPIDGRHFDDFFVDQVYIHEYSTILLVIAIYKFFTHWQQQQKEASRLMQAKLQTEIRLLKTQVNPDFMVNSLDNLQTLIDRHDQQAPAVVLKLAHFLSYVLYESSADQVPLERDVAAMRAYIDLEKERLGDQMDISLNITGSIAGQVIAPLLWLPFLTNAFQHGLTRTDQAWLSLNLSATGDIEDSHDSLPAQLKFSLANSIDLAQEANCIPGNGLKAIHKRLETRYPGRYELKNTHDNGVYLVVLTLQLDSLYGPINTALTFAGHTHEPTVPHR